MMARRSARIACTSAAALAAGLLANPAAAQTAGTPSFSYNASTPTVVSGSVDINRGRTPGQETYTVNTPTAVLDFVPFDTATNAGAPINFQNANTQVTYVNGQGVANYTVLNRIVPTDRSRPIVFNGTVVSNLQQGQARGGTVWFYSPGGIGVSSSAVFNVGNLLLTSADPTGGTGVISNTASFAAGGTGNAAISVAAGASINALNAGSYVALVAPAVNMNGAVRINGQAAYVAAEQATLTIRNGLFDIVVPAGGGTTVQTPLIHSGSTTGPASTAAADRHAVYLVAIPKNNAIQMLVGQNSTIGFDTATSATVENGRVLLSAGRNVTAGNIAFTAPPSAATADIIISGGRFTSGVFGRATGDALAASTAATATFDGDVTLAAIGRAQIAARRAGETLRVGGNATVLSEGSSTSMLFPGETAPRLTATAVEASFYADNGGTLRIAGTAAAVANATATLAAAGGGAVATAGSAQVFTQGAVASTIDIGGPVILQANASGNDAAGPVGLGAILTGGVAGVNASPGGRITLRGGVSISTDAVGTVSSIGSAGRATGGNSYIGSTTGGQISITGDAVVTAVATGDDALQGGTGGMATGGRATIGGNGLALTISGGVDLGAEGTGGSARAGGDGGDGTGGAAGISTNGTAATTTIDGSAAVSAFGAGGVNGGGGDGVAGNGTGGSATIIAGGGSLRITGAATAGAAGTGGAKVAGQAGGGGAGAGGTSSAGSNGGALSLGSSLTLGAIGTGGAATGSGGNGGAGTGGTVRIFANIAPTASVTVAGASSLTTNGTGGAASNAVGAVGGSGQASPASVTGGSTRNLSVNAQQGAITLASLTINGIGTGGAGPTGGAGAGGSAFLGADTGALRVNGTTNIAVDGIGAAARSIATLGVGGGNGGAGTGGIVDVFASAQAANPGSITLANVNATGTSTGGAGAAGVASQNNGAGGRGGDAGSFVTPATLTISAAASGGAIRTGAVQISGSSTGGAGGAGASGGVGGAGGRAISALAQVGSVSSIDLPPTTGSLTAGAVTLVSNSTGGAGGSGVRGGNGGNSIGGRAMVLVRGTPVTLGSVALTAIGTGGAGGAGATAGTAGVATAENSGSGIIVSKRFQRPERGSLTITGAATANLTGVSVFSITDSDATFGSVFFQQQGPVTNNQTPSFIDVGNSITTISGIGQFVSTGDVGVTVRDNGQFRVGELDVTSGGSIVPVAVVPVGDGVTGGTAGTAAPIQSLGGTIDLEAAGDVRLASDIRGASTGPSVSVDAGRNVQVANISGGALVGLLARTGGVTAGNLTATGSVAIGAATSVTTGTITTGRTANDTLYIGNTSALATDPLFAPLNAGNSVDPTVFLRATVAAIGGTLTTGAISTGNLRAGASGFAFSGIDAATRIELATPGTARFSTSVSAPNIAVTSGDIVIDPGVTLGGATTQSLTLTALGPMIVGGDGSATAGYRLDAAELARVRANRILINAAATTQGVAPNVIVRAFSLNGSASTTGVLTGANASLTIQSPGVLRVEGPVALNNAASTDRLALIGATRVEVSADGGSVGVFGASPTTPAGTLAVTAPVIGVASSALLAKLADNPRYTGRDAEFATPAATPKPEGYVQANRIELEASNVIAIQNNGTAATPAGFSTGSGGLLIRSTAQTTPLDVVASGRTADAAGAVLTGRSAVQAVSTAGNAAGAPLISSTSTVNGCGLGVPCASGTPVVLNPDTVLSPDVGDPAQAASVPAIRIVRLLDEAGIESEPAITDPIAGSGNPGLWNDDEEDEDENGDGIPDKKVVTAPGARK